MSHLRYDFEGLWFDIYKKVLQQNEQLGDNGLDKNQLREVTTSIFIAQTQKGVNKPLVLSAFMESVLSRIQYIRDRKQQEAVFKSINTIIKEHQHAKL